MARSHSSPQLRHGDPTDAALEIEALRGQLDAAEAAAETAHVHAMAAVASALAARRVAWSTLGVAAVALAALLAHLATHA